MGIVQSFKSYCLEDSKDAKKSMFGEVSEMISDDYQFFQDQKWYRFQTHLYFDPNKFIFLYPSYKKTQLQLIQLWNVVNIKMELNSGELASSSKIMSQKWKYAIRKGVPIIYYKSIIQSLFHKNNIPRNNKENYRQLLTQVSSDKQQVSKNFHTPFLSQEGIEAVMRILHLLKQRHGQLKFNSYLPQVIGLLLIFIDEEKAYEILNFMIQKSSNLTEQSIESLHWYFIMTEQQMERFAEDFFTRTKKVSPTMTVINNHLNRERMNKLQIFRQLVENFFFGYLPFPVILKIFLNYLNEGVQAFYQIIYAICKTAGPAIRDATNTKAILRSIRKKMLTQLNQEHSVRRFFHLAYDLRINPNFNLQKLLSEHQMPFLQEKCYYLPIIQGQSQILSFEDLETIWSYLPNKTKHFDIRKIYPNPSIATKNLKNLKETIEHKNLVLMIIQTVQQSVFGIFFLQKLVQPENKSLQEKQASVISNFDEQQNKLEKSKKTEEGLFKYSGSPQNFVFTLHPNRAKFISSKENVFYYFSNETLLVVGGPANKPALQLDFQLLSGLSFSSPTYANTPLHNGPPGQFRISKLECFCIQ